MPAWPVIETSRTRRSRDVAWNRSLSRRSSASRPTNGASRRSSRPRPRALGDDAQRPPRRDRRDLALEQLLARLLVGDRARSSRAGSPRRRGPRRPGRPTGAATAVLTRSPATMPWSRRAERHRRLAGEHAAAGLDPGAERPHGVDQLEGRADRALGVVLVRGRGAPDGHHGVADELLDRAAVAADDVGRELEVRDRSSRTASGSRPSDERREADEVREQDRDQAALRDRPAGSRRARRPDAARRARRGGRRPAAPGEGRPALAAEPGGRGRSACRSAAQAAARRVPHSPQNLRPGSLGVPQAGAGHARGGSLMRAQGSASTVTVGAPDRYAGCAAAGTRAVRTVRQEGEQGPVATSAAAHEGQRRRAADRVEEHARSERADRHQPDRERARRRAHPAQQGVRREQRPQRDVRDEDVRVDDARDERRPATMTGTGDAGGDDERGSRRTPRRPPSITAPTGLEREPRRGHRAQQRPEREAPTGRARRPPRRGPGRSVM